MTTLTFRHLNSDQRKVADGVRSLNRIIDIYLNVAAMWRSQRAANIGVSVARLTMQLHAVEMHANLHAHVVFGRVNKQVKRTERLWKENKILRVSTD